jgi:hypothetical protein
MIEQLLTFQIYEPLVPQTNLTLLIGVDVIEPTGDIKIQSGTPDE